MYRSLSVLFQLHQLTMGRVLRARTNIRSSPLAARPLILTKVRLGIDSDQDPLFNGSLDGGKVLGKGAARELNNRRLKNALIAIAGPRPARKERGGYRITAVDMCIAVDREADASKIGSWFQGVSLFFCDMLQLYSYFHFLGDQDRNR